MIEYKSGFTKFIMEYAEASSISHTLKQLRAVDKMPMGEPDKKNLKKAILGNYDE